MHRFLVLCVLGLGIPSTTCAQAQAGVKAKKKGPLDTVRYSYEKWSRTQPARYVLMPRPIRIKGGDLADKTRSLMRALTAAKRGSYGDARLAFQKDYKTTNVVYVWLDKCKAQYHRIVMAETVYTFTENGASKVIFPGVKPQGWSRQNVPYSAYVLSVPFWQVLPPNTLSAALVQMPDGSLLQSEAAVKRLKSGDQKLADALWKYASEGGQPAMAAVKAAIHLKFADLADRLLPLLNSADQNLRRAAIEGLRNNDNATVNAALRKVVDDDPDSKLQDLAASILAKSKDPKYSAAAQYHALKSKDPTIVLAAAKALGSSKQAEALKQLIDIIGHEDSRVREAAITSLDKRGDHGDLVKQLKNEKLSKEIRAEIAVTLRNQENQEVAHPALLFLAVDGKGKDAENAAMGLGKFDKSETYPSLGKALKHSDAAVRRAAAKALATLGKPIGLKHLASASVEDKESGKAVIEAIRGVYARQKLDFVMKGTRETNAILKRAAVATLGELVKKRGGKRSRKKILATLRPLSRGQDAAIRAATARSFEIMAADDVRADVLRLAEDKAVEVQRAVAHALRAFGSPEATRLLLKYVAAQDPQVVANAAESIGVLKIKEGLNPVIRHLGHKVVEVRRAATKALVQIGSTLPKRKPLLSFFSERLFDADGQVRLTAIEGLRLVKDPRTVTAMGALIQDPLLSVRVATLNAMADTGHPSAVDAIAGALEDDDKSIRKAALLALGKLGRKEAIPTLTGYVSKERDSALIEIAKTTLAKLK